METNSKPITVKEVLEDVRNMLSNLNIPASQIEPIGIPIAKAINGIALCIDAFSLEEAKEKKEAQEEPEINIIPAEENEEDA